MKVTVIYGQSHRGITWTISQLMLEYLQPDTVDEFMLPVNGVGSCIGCNRCFLEGEGRCPHHDAVERIVNSLDSADVIILASPNYVDGMTGAMKDLMDHLAFMWMSHRPRESMFSKVGIVIASSAGAGNGNVLKSMRKQMLNWMIPRVYTLGLISRAWGIDDLADKKRRYVDRRCRSIASSVSSGLGRPCFSLRQRFMFSVFRSMQSGKMAWNPTDREWWEQHGWLDEVRPWKSRRGEP